MMDSGNDNALQAGGSASPDSDTYPPQNETEKRYLSLLALSRVSAAVSGLRDLDAILKVGLDSVLNIMGGAVGGVLLLDEKEKVL